MLRWFFDMVSEPWWSSGHEFESHNSYLFDKNQAQSNMSLYKFQSQRAFIWGGELENKINHILKPHIIA
jgi:hypothetical protein